MLTTMTGAPDLSQRASSPLSATFALPLRPGNGRCRP